MSKPKPLGLIASGRMVESPLARFPALARSIGPVVASSRRVASRYANALRSGHAAEYAELSDCPLIVLQVPWEELTAALGAMLASAVEWTDRAVVLLDDDRDSSALAPLRGRRAAVSSAGMAPPLGRPLMVVEGDAAAVAAVRAWIESARIHVIELKAGAKPLFALGVSAGATLVTPVVDVAMRSLRAAGLSGPEAWRVLGYVVDSAVRDYQAHGRKAWLSPAAGDRRTLSGEQMRALAALDPALEQFYARALRAALELFGEPAEWVQSAGQEGVMGATGG